MKVLAGDVGGTHCRLAVCEAGDGKVLRLIEDIQPSASFASFAEIVRPFVAAHGVDVRGVCFGMPGPVRGRRAQLTNLPWIVDADELERDLGLPSVSLINDLEAFAHGLETLAPADFRVIREGAADLSGNAGLVSAGTGLGEAGLHRVDGKLIPFATEGGHTDFAPHNDLEYELGKFLGARFGSHVSWERVLCGPGLGNVYDFFAERDGAPTPDWLVTEFEQGERGEVITRNALAGKDPACEQALELFMALYGAEAGNFALKVLATDGIYLGGGIAPKIVDALASSRFLERFDDKGRMRALVEQITVRVVMNEKAALQGAAIYASRRAGP